MGVIRITKDFRFETGHALYGYDGKCKNIHGHNFKLSVTVTGSPITDKSHPKYGMVIDFSDLKKIINTQIIDAYDNATVFNKNTPHIEEADFLSNRGHKILEVDFQPTSEMMVINFAKIITPKLPDNIKLHSLKLQETDTSCAEWFASDNK